MADLLSSWCDGRLKLAILDFVSRVTTKGRADFVPPADRIAVFDNDGTLWCEQPQQVQFFFGRARLVALAGHDASLMQRQPFKAYLEHDVAGIHEMGKRGLFQVAAAVHAGMTEEVFDQMARTWLAKARHPKLAVPFTKLVYQPAGSEQAHGVSKLECDLHIGIVGIIPMQVIGKSRFQKADDRTIQIIDGSSKEQQRTNSPSIFSDRACRHMA